MRIQILDLPRKVVGGVVEHPFAIIFDEVGANMHEWLAHKVTVKDLKKSTGASAVMAFEETVEVV